ncbi:hypothetical protein ANCCEY_14090 [Ancylostoma ceylanicum]|uniref:Cytoplasmic tRNA 2-thiolation protein 2 n=1 Tax=Ancylostoma ceylanicum TaxID=53326 RepID=A0A0D6L7C6_9BILA|nr:hypothetical protein ANCCEY_14090 [Ancylostoma ceylanicum]
MAPSIPQDEHCLDPSQSAEKCVKCSREGVVHGSSKMAYCEDCFVTMVKGKFRSAISKRKIFKDGDRKVLVLIDGLIESAFLFRQVEDAVKQKNFKRLMIEPSFVLLLSCTDTSVVHVLEERLTTLRQTLQSNFYIVHLAAVFGDLDVVDDNSHNPGKREAENRARLWCLSIEWDDTRLTY